MGREAFLARKTLGRSAFDSPLKADDGECVLGGQTHIYDDRNYVQQWNERGHPVNTESDRRDKEFKMAQMEVFEACGIVIRKDSAMKERRFAKRVVENHQIQDLENENLAGMILKYSDRQGGLFLTWWLFAIRRRIGLVSF